MQLFWFMYFNQLYMFRAMFSPIIGRISLQLQLLVMSTDAASSKYQLFMSITPSVHFTGTFTVVEKSMYSI